MTNSRGKRKEYYREQGKKWRDSNPEYNREYKAKMDSPILSERGILTGCKAGGGNCFTCILPDCILSANKDELPEDWDE